ncbi:centromere protein N-like [Liolophura sinensis]|uniref:centromere protein N-like n=1 Tax=Liolophura sinensis TaxID=3198878 RepID=UPI00315920DA
MRCGLRHHFLCTQRPRAYFNLIQLSTSKMPDKNSLERIVSRFKTTEICPALERWGHLTQDDINEVKTAGTKQQMILEVCDRCVEREVDEEATAELDIMYVHLHSKTKTWSVYELIDPKEEKPISVNPAVIQWKLDKKLGQHFDAVVCTKVLDKAVWIRLSLGHGVMGRGSQIRFTNDVVYIVHYPRTSFFIATPIKASFKNRVTETIVSILGYFSSKEMQLKGHCLSSLADIALNKNSQGGKNLPGDHTNPLTSSRRQKRKEKDEELGEGVTREDDPKRQRRMGVLENTFGPYVQPTLEKIEFKLETQFRGFGLTREQSRSGNVSRLERFFPVLERAYNRKDGPEVFRCHVKFEGKSVLEGLRNLGDRGLASVPLPKHLTCVPSRAKNYFILGDKARHPRPQRSPAPP